MQIVSCAARTAELFRLGKEAHVHSAYKNTVNLLTDVGLFSLQTLSVPPTPISIVLDCDAEQLAQFSNVTQPLRFCERGILFGSKMVGISPTCRAYCGALKKKGQKSPNVVLFCETLREALQRLAPKESLFTALGAQQFEDSFAGRVGKSAREILREAQKSISNGETATETLCGLLGLGLGLTPSGDDFLLGVMAGCDLVSRTNSMFYKSLTQQIGGALTRTNAISARFLDCACNGEYADSLRAVLQSVLDDVSGSELQKVLARAVEIGHSSGSDALSGVLWYLNLAEEGDNDGSLQ